MADLSHWTNWALDGIISPAMKTLLVKPPEIQSYHFGQMVVDGEAHGRDLILLPERLVANWWRKDGHRLDIDDLQEVLSAIPDVLVVGYRHPPTGRSYRRSVADIQQPARGSPNGRGVPPDLLND